MVRILKVLRLRPCPLVANCRISSASLQFAMERHHQRSQRQHGDKGKTDGHHRKYRHYQSHEQASRVRVDSGPLGSNAKHNRIEHQREKATALCSDEDYILKWLEGTNDEPRVDKTGSTKRPETSSKIYSTLPPRVRWGDVH
jgi:hypothetical protein